MDKKTVCRIGGMAAGVVLLYCALQNLNHIGAFLGAVLSIISPVFLGFAIAFVLNIPMSFLERKWEAAQAAVLSFTDEKRKKRKPVKTKKNRFGAAVKRPICLLLSIAFIIGVLALVLALVLPELGKTFSVLMVEIPKFFERAAAWATEHSKEWPLINEKLSQVKIDWEQTIKNLLAAVGSGTIGLVNFTVSTVSMTVSAIVDFVVAFIFSIYVLMNKERLGRQFGALLEAFLPEKAQDVCLHLARTVYRIFSRFITGQCMEAVILGSLCAIGMMLFGFPYAGMIGALVGVTALVPIVGAFLGAFVGAFMILMQNPLQALMFVIYLTALQQIEGNLIYPRVVGQSVGLPAMWVLVAVTIGGGIGGVPGMLFAVPTASVLYTLLREAVKKRNARKEAES